MPMGCIFKGISLKRDKAYETMQEELDIPIVDEGLCQVP